MNINEKINTIRSLHNMALNTTKTNSKMSKDELVAAHIMRVQHCQTYLNNMDNITKEIKTYITKVQSNSKAKLIQLSTV